MWCYVGIQLASYKAQLLKNEGTMKSLFLAFSLLFSINTFASYSYIAHTNFHCSDGKTYNLLTDVSGGWGPETRKVIGMCKAGIISLTKDEVYNVGLVWGGGIEGVHEEVRSCLKDESSRTVACWKEYQKTKEIISADSYTQPLTEKRNKSRSNSGRNELEERVVYEYFEVNGVQYRKKTVIIGNN